MHYSVLRLRGLRMAAVMVDVGRLHDDALIAQLQTQFALPVMLVARHDGNWKGAKARAQFDATPYLGALLALEDVEWSEVAEPTEPELPF